MLDETFLAGLEDAGLLEAVREVVFAEWEQQMARVLREKQGLAEANVTRESGAIDGLGYIESDIPPEVFFYWLNQGRRMGVDNVWKHEEFRREFLRDHPQYRVRYRRKAMVGYTGPAKQNVNPGLLIQVAPNPKPLLAV